MKYTACGAINCSISYTIFLALYVVAGFHYAPAAGVGYCAGMVNSFILNRTFTFKATGALPPMLARFALVTGLGITFNVLVLHGLVTAVRLSPAVAQIFALMSSGSVNFAANKLWTFRPLGVGSGHREPVESADLFGTTPDHSPRTPRAS